MASNQILCQVREIRSNKSFINLSRSSTAQVCLVVGEVPVVCIEKAGQDDVYFSVAGHLPDGAHPTVEVGAGRGLEAGSSVLVKRPREPDVSLATRVVVTPASENDWNILELNQHATENAVLEQIRVVQEGRLILLKVKNLPLRLKVKSVIPSSKAVVLQKMTELVIDPPDNLEKGSNHTKPVQAYTKTETNFKSDLKDNIKKPLHNSGIFNSMAEVLRPVKTWFDTEKVQTDSSPKGNVQSEFLNKSLTSCLRVFQCSQVRAPYTCLVSNRTFPNCDKPSFIAQITPIPLPNPQVEKKPDMRKATESQTHYPVFVKISMCEDEELVKGGIYISETYMRWKGIEVSSQVFVQSVQYSDKYSNVKSEELTLNKGPEVDLTSDSLVLKGLFNKESTVVPRDSPLIVKPSSETKAEILLTPSFKSTLEFVWVTEDVRISLKDSKSPGVHLELQTNQLSNYYMKNSKKMYSDLFEKEASECTNYIKKHLNLEDSCIVNYPNHILVTGSTGMGKTSFVNQIGCMLGRSRQAVFSKIINCKSLKGKRGEVIKNQLETAVEETKFRHPGIVFLDDLESLVPAIDEERPELQNQSLASWIRKLLLGLSNKNCGVLVIASASSESTLHPHLRPEQGSVPFRKVVDLPVPGQSQRENLFSHFLSGVGIETTKKAISLSEGFAVKDIEAVCQRLLTNDGELTPDALNTEIEKYTPLSRWGQHLQPVVLRNLDSIGALHDARKTLIQTLLWPSKYPEIFSKCGVRTPRGILLYGAPGTGKTLLAEAIASYTGLNFIPVKGPELLSKYIGASEAAVRETFQRAEACKPCIIFFDEFDSLAPRRGHDSTGVTDRVVNQLLTQLDGVEGLEGVWIMAASSRPDLIDPALLRPGRIEKTVLCPLPTKDDRKEILQVLSKKLNLSEDVNLEDIAEETQGLTGADLSALMFTAQLAAFQTNSKVKSVSHKENLEMRQTKYNKPLPDMAKQWPVNFKDGYTQSKTKESNGQVNCFMIEQKHLKEAAKNTKPSVDGSQLIKYNQIYNSFGSDGFPNKNENIKQRATLA